MSPRKERIRRPAEEARLAKVGRAIVDDAAIDWDAECERAPLLRDGLRRMQDLERLVKAHRAVAAARATGSETPPGLFDWGPFRALELVGEGAFGLVYRALDVRLRREVALKLRRSDGAGAGEGVRRFLDEARHLARVRHSNVLVVHGADVHDQRAGFWTDFIRGRTLTSIVEQEGAFTAEEAARIGVDLCHALHAVHAAGLIHGDVKASNVMREEGGRILLMDFGAVTHRSREGASEPAIQAFGTPLFLAPEVLRGEPTSACADLYSLGVLLHFLVMRAVPVEAVTMTELLRAHAARSSELESLTGRELPPLFVRALERALAVEPQARYGSAEDMERGLLAALPSPSDRDAGAQSLRVLLDELGRVPEKLCRHIGAEIVNALLRERVGAGDADELELDHILLLGDGGVRLLRDGRRADRAEIADFGRLLYELATGRTAEPEFDDRATEPLSPFLRELLRQLASRNDEPEVDGGVSTLSALVTILSDGEAGPWWRTRRRELRRNTVRRLPHPPMARDTALHGREGAVRDLRHAFEDARAGRGRVVLLTGEAGIGKSRLADELIGQLERGGEDFQCLFGSFPPGGTFGEAGAFLSAYRTFLGEDDLENALADYLSDAPLLVAPLLSLLAGQNAPSEADRSSRDLVQRAFVQLTLALADNRTTVIWIDDLHFASGDGRELFAALAQSVAEHRILLLGTSRPSLPSDWSANLLRLEHAEELILARLQTDDVRLLLNEALASPSLADELTPGLTARSDGNPLFLFEYLRALEAGGRLAESAPLQARYRLWGLSTPGSIQRLIQTRFAALADEDQELLDVASCLGFEFDPELVARALGHASLGVLRRFAGIERRHRLIRSSGRGYVFDHHEAQQAMYLGLFEPLRELYHAALARAVEEQDDVASAEPAALPGPRALFLAEHFLRGGMPAKALAFLRPAMEHLEGTYQYDAAVQVGDLALATEGLLTGVARCEILTAKQRCLAIQGRAAEEEATLRENFEVAERAGELRARAEAHALLGDCAMRRSSNEEACTLLETACRLGEEAGDLTVQQFAVLTLGTLYLRQGRFEDARVAYEQSLSLAQARGHLRGQATASGHLGIALGMQGKNGEARKHFEQSLALAREIGYPLAETLAVCNLGVAADLSGRFEEACAYHQQYLELARKLGFRRGQGTARANWGASLRALGRSAEAIEQLELSLPLLRETRYRNGEADALETLGSTLVMLGAWEEARIRFEAALLIGREIENPKEEADALVGLGRVAEQLESLEPAERSFRDALAICERIEHDEGTVVAALALGALLMTQGRTSEARERIASALTTSQREEVWSVVVQAAVHLAALTGEDLGPARALFARYGDRLALTERMETCYLLWRSGGKSEDLAEARRLFGELEEHAPARYRESMRTAVPLYRKLLAG